MAFRCVSIDMRIEFMSTPSMFVADNRKMNSFPWCCCPVPYANLCVCCWRAYSLFCLSSVRLFGWRWRSLDGERCDDACTSQHKLTLIGYVIFVFVLNDFDWKRPYYNSHRTEKREFMKPRCVISHLIHTHSMPFFSLFRSSSVRMCVVWVDGCVCASLSSSGMLGTFEHIHFVWLTTMSRCANKWDMSKATMITTPATQNIQFITKCGILSFSFT